LNWPGWDRLPPLPRAPLTLNELETQWTVAVAADGITSREPHGPRGAFLSEHLDEVLHELSRGAAVWRVRLKRFVADTAQWRSDLRAVDVTQQNSVRLRQVIAALRCWQRLATPAERESEEGRWNRSYLEMCHASNKDAGQGASRIRQLRQAASIVDPDRPPAVPATGPHYLAMKRRSLTLSANAKRIESFLLMRRRPQQWDEIAAGFAEAAALNEEANRCFLVSNDRGVAINRLWETLAAMRAAEARMDLEAARASLAQAKVHATELEEPFRYGGRWSSVTEVAAERHIIDCLEELAKGASASPDLVVEHLKRWQMNAGKGVPPPRTTRTLVMRARHLTAEIARSVSRGEPIAVELAALRRMINADPYVKVGFEGIVAALRVAERTGSSAYPAVVAELRTHLLSVDGDTRSLPPAASTDLLTPPWARAADDSDTEAAAALVRYLRVIAEYLWCVYRDSAIELSIDIPALDPRWFQAMPPGQAGAVIDGLRQALNWDDSRYPAQALYRLGPLASEASRLLTEGKLIGLPDLLSATFDATLVDLCPLVVEGIGEPLADFPADIPVVRRIGRNGTEMVTGAAAAPPSWPCFALKPRYKQRDLLTQVISQRHVKPIHLYSAESWPRPSRVRVLVEGASDVTALWTYLDARMPWWKGYDVRIEYGDGDSLPARFRHERKRLQQDRDRADAIVVVADADKRGLSSWDEIWKHPHTFVLDPDLELHHVPAFVEMLMILFDQEMDAVDLYALHDRYRREKAEKLTRNNFADWLTDELVIGGSIKDESTGAVLGQRLAHYGSPVLDRIAERIDLLANGFAPGPHPMRRP